jgi:hypothetical protein
VCSSRALFLNNLLPPVFKAEKEGSHHQKNFKPATHLNSALQIAVLTHFITAGVYNFSKNILPSVNNCPSRVVGTYF